MSAFTVNDTYCDQRTIQKQHLAFASLPHLVNCRGRRYAVCLPDTAEWLSLFLYLKDHGASVAPLHPASPLEAAREQAQKAECHDLIFGQATAHYRVNDADVDAEPGMVLFSSGTTGGAKTVCRSWQAIDRELRAYVSQSEALDALAPVLACSTTHSYGLLSGFLGSIMRGLTPRIITNANPKYVLRAALAASNSLLFATPTLLRVLVPLLGPGRAFHAVMTSGAPLSQIGFSQLRERAEHVLQQYGCSEVGCISLNLDVQAPHELGTPLEHLRVTAGSSSSQPEEICVHTPDGVIETRDLGFYGERGLCFLARIDDMVNVAGVNVYPSDVEDAVADFNGVTEVVAYRRRDTWAGERVAVCFVANSEVDIEQLRQWCTSRLTPFQMPLELLQVQAIPRTNSGKISRKLVADTLSSETASATSWQVTA